MKRGDVESCVFFSSLYPDQCPKPLPPCTAATDFETSILKLGKDSGPAALRPQTVGVTLSPEFLEWAKELNESLIEKEDLVRDVEREKRREKLLVEARADAPIPTRISKDVHVPSTVFVAADLAPEISESDAELEPATPLFSSTTSTSTPDIAPAANAPLSAEMFAPGPEPTVIKAGADDLANATAPKTVKTPTTQTTQIPASADRTIHASDDDVDAENVETDTDIDEAAPPPTTPTKVSMIAFPPSQAEQNPTQFAASSKPGVTGQGQAEAAAAAGASTPELEPEVLPGAGKQKKKKLTPEEKEEAFDKQYAGKWPC
jgi:hypothetical protein